MGFFFVIRTVGLLMMLTVSMRDFIMFALLPKTYQKCQLSYWSIWSECEQENGVR
uniref:SSD domain-containing protein n=1 Tax=Ascaris lumbricoides TaxID=6252 RepID=A0A0M3IK23_ASCLU